MRSHRRQLSRHQLAEACEVAESRRLLSATRGAEHHEAEFTLPRVTRFETSLGSTQSQPDDTAAIAIGFLKSNTSDFNLTAADLDHFRITDRYRSSHNGVTHLYLQQTLNDIPVHSAAININVANDGRILSAASSFMSGLAQRNPASSVDEAIASADAVSSAAAFLAIDPAESVTEVDASLQYRPISAEDVELAWNVNFRNKSTGESVTASLNASNGSVMHVEDHVHHLGGSYRVFAQPAENPLDGRQSFVTGIEDPVASPFGWHDTDGVAGPEFLDTRGNNAVVQDDLDANNSGGSRPTGGAALEFHDEFDVNGSASDNLNAAITNAFYWTNLLHDVHYQYGFDEAAGNFQTNNYGRGGLANDPIIVDVQDGASTTGGFFLPTADGASPRMTLHFGSPFPTISADSPFIAADQIPTGTALFGPAVPAPGITGTLATAEPALACSPLTNPDDVAGKIALIDRGACNFTVKVKNAQDAGAVAVVVANNIPGLLTMSGDDPSITIASVFVSQEYGTALKDAVASEPVNLTISTPQMRDLSLDNDVIVHEFGHGVSSRLTGGPSATGQLNHRQSIGMGEGWSDFWPLMFAQTESDQPGDPRLIAEYFTPFGLRSLPYSFDMSVNSLTYEDIQGLTVEHDIGEVWASVLWDLNWILINGDDDTLPGYGFDSDLYHGTGGNNVALQLVMDGLKLQPGNPTFLEARDAILLADRITFDGANQTAIWTAFARRGMGVGADDGGSANSTSVTNSFETPADLVATAFNVVSDDVPNGQTDVSFTIANVGTTPASAFETHVVWSANDVVGDSDDMIVAGSTVAHSGVAGGAELQHTMSIQLDQAALFEHALRVDVPDADLNTISQAISHLFLVVDSAEAVAESGESNNSGRGSGLDSDDISYFPWDLDGNDVVTPRDALVAISQIATNSANVDFDGNGIVTPLEALSSVQRIGYRRNDSVIASLHSGVAATPRFNSTEGSSSIASVTQSSRDEIDTIFSQQAASATPEVPDVEDDLLPIPDSAFEDVTDWLSVI